MGDSASRSETKFCLQSRFVKKNNFLSKNGNFILLVEDDIHFIHATRHPTTSQTSTSWHMCTALADIHTNIPAVPQNDEVTDNHISVRVTMKDHTVRACRGGIDINHLLGFLCVELPKYFSTSFLTFLPDDDKRFNFSNVEESFENLRYKYINLKINISWRIITLVSRFNRKDTY